MSQTAWPCSFSTFASGMVAMKPLRARAKSSPVSFGRVRVSASSASRVAAVASFGCSITPPARPVAVCFGGRLHRPRCEASHLGSLAVGREGELADEEYHVEFRTCFRKRCQNKLEAHEGLALMKHLACP